MLWFTGKGSARTCDGVTRRDFLHAGALAAVGLSLPQLFALQAKGAVKKDADERRVHHDLQPRGAEPDRPVRPQAGRAGRDPRAVQAASRPRPTDIQLTELLPLHAKIADKFSLVRSVYHTAAAVHDTGHQMMQTGRLFTGGHQYAARRVRAAVPQGAAERTAGPRDPAGGDGADRREHAARAGRRVPRQGVRPVRARVPTPARRTSRCRTCCRRPTSARPARSAAGNSATWWTRTVKEFEASETAGLMDERLPQRVQADDQHQGPRRVRPDARSRRPSASATA